MKHFVWMFVLFTQKFVVVHNDIYYDPLYLIKAIKNYKKI